MNRKPRSGEQMNDATRHQNNGLSVLFLTRKWPPAVGGMETYSAELTQDLATMVDLEIRVLPGRADGSPPTMISLLSFLMGSLMFLWRRRGDFDVAHFGDFVLFPLAWWHSLVAPLRVRVITVHGLDLIYGNRSGFKPALYRLFVAWARRRRCVHHFVANSRNTAEICSSAGFTPTTPIPLGIRLQPGCKPLATDASDPYVLFIGRVVKRKGAAWFAQHVLPQLPDRVTFHVVGKVWDREEGSTLENNPRVVMYGRVPTEELERQKAGAAVIVMPNVTSEGDTDVEGFGLVALEAAASGAPLVASRTQGITDAVRDGETGFLVESGDAATWLAKLQELLRLSNEERRQFHEKAISMLERHYSWSRVAKDTLCTYRQAVDRNRNRTSL